jgi:hypothetical protein
MPRSFDRTVRILTRVFLALAALAVLGHAQPARAQAEAQVAHTVTTDDGYGYVFKDDLMRGAGLNPGGPMIRVSPHAVRNLRHPLISTAPH